MLFGRLHSLEHESFVISEEKEAVGRTRASLEVPDSLIVGCRRKGIEDLLVSHAESLSDTCENLWCTLSNLDIEGTFLLNFVDATLFMLLNEFVG